MKSMKMMLLGLAFLIIAACGIPFWVAGAAVGAITFFTGLVAGMFLCIAGYLKKDE